MLAAIASWSATPTSKKIASVNRVGNRARQELTVVSITTTTTEPMPAAAAHQTKVTP